MDPLSVYCSACNTQPPYPCMDCILTPQAQTDCWEVKPHQARVDAAKAKENLSPQAPQ